MCRERERETERERESERETDIKISLAKTGSSVKRNIETVVERSTQKDDSEV